MRASCLLLAVLLFIVAAPRDVAAEPAVGFGAAAKGGEGHPVVWVTTLEDSRPNAEPIPGSLRDALTGGNRMVRFGVSGNIQLLSDLQIRYSHVTIDGSNAPGGGVALWGYSLVIDADDVIVRNLRFRGSHPTAEHDGLVVAGGRDILIDHVSCSWATDECISIYGYGYTGSGTVRNLTIQHSLIAEAPAHKPYGMLVDGDVADVTWYRNVFAKNPNRNPQITTGRRGLPGNKGKLLSGVGRYELLQNVVYDAIYSTRLENQSPDWTIELDVIGNLWKPGPQFPAPKIPLMVFDDPPSRGPIHVYAAENVDLSRVPHKPVRDCDVFSLERPNMPCSGWSPDHAASARQVKHHAAPAGRAADALDEILAAAGATLPCRDAADRRVIDEVRTGSGRPVGKTPPPLPDLSRCP